MRHALTGTLLAALLCAGCEKPQGPQTTEPISPGKTAAKPLPALEPPGTETPMGTDVYAPPVRPTPVARPELLVTPDSARRVDTASSDTYVVQKGDTLWKIATKVYGNGQRYRDIQAANPGLDPSKLKVGQKLVVPK